MTCKVIKGEQVIIPVVVTGTKSIPVLGRAIKYFGGMENKSSPRAPKADGINRPYKSIVTADAAVNWKVTLNTFQIKRLAKYTSSENNRKFYSFLSHNLIVLFSQRKTNNI